MSEVVPRGSACGQPGVLRARSGFVQWVMRHHRISERAAFQIEDALTELRAVYMDETILTGDPDVLVYDFVADLPRERRETIGWSRCSRPFGRAVRDFRRYCAEVGP